MKKPADEDDLLPAWSALASEQFSLLFLVN